MIYRTHNGQTSAYDSRRDTSGGLSKLVTARCDEDTLRRVLDAGTLPPRGGHGSRGARKIEAQRRVDAAGLAQGGREMGNKIGDEIKVSTGHTGNLPHGRIVWLGTAEDIGEMARGRVPAALVSTPQGEFAATLIGPNKDQMDYPAKWTINRASREWETPDGELVNGDLASRIDAALTLNWRVIKK